MAAFHRGGDRTGIDDVVTQIRPRIDQVDAQVRELFCERMALAKQVACVKARTEDRIFKPDREAAILQKQTQGIAPELVMEYRALLRRMMEISRKYQYGLILKMRDCFPYPIRTRQPETTRLAMVREELHICDFRSRDEVMLASSYDQIADWIDAGKADAGAGIIEKIGSGVSDELNSLLMRRGYTICECRVIAVEGRYAGKQELPETAGRADTGQYPSATGQDPVTAGQESLATGQDPVAAGHETLSTGQETTVTGQETSSAEQKTISSAHTSSAAMEKYKVVLFTKNLTVLPDHNRVKLVFIAPNKSGALGSILSMIADYGVNVTEIHSIPYRTGEDWNYRFFVELEMNLLKETSKTLIFQLSQETMELQLLGSYRCVGDFVR